MDKKELRQMVRQKKRAMTDEEIQMKSDLLEEKFLNSEAYRNAKAIYGYLPYNQEVRTVSMLHWMTVSGWQSPKFMAMRCVLSG